MNKKYLLVGLVSAASLCAMAEVSPEITSLMKDGEFKKVETAISQKGSGLTAVEADSLRAIMKRIEADFSGV